MRRARRRQGPWPLLPCAARRADGESSLAGMKPDRGGKMAGAAQGRKSRPVVAPSSRPIAERGLDERQRRHRRRIGAQDSRAEAQAQHARNGEDRGPLVVVEAAFGADEEADAVLRADFAERVERARLRRLLVAEREETL